MAKKSLQAVKAEDTNEDSSLAGNVDKKTPKKLKTPKKSISKTPAKDVTESPAKSPKKRKSNVAPDTPISTKKKASTFVPQPAKSKKLPKQKKPSKKQELTQQDIDDFSEADCSDNTMSGDESEEEKLYDDVPLSDTSEDEDEPAEKETPAQKKKKSKDFLEKDASRTIFVGNLPNTMKEGDLKKIFKKYGPIESTRFRCAAVADVRTPKKVAVITKQFHEERNNINAFVLFKEEASVEKSLEANGQVVQGHHIRVDSCKKKASYDNNKAIFIGNLPFSVEEDKLWEVFGTCGDIESVRIVRDALTGLGKGIAFVNFKTSDAIELALMKNGYNLQKRQIRVTRYSTPTTTKGRTLSKHFNKKMLNRKMNQENKKMKSGGKKKAKKTQQDSSFQGQTVETGKVAKKEKKPKLSAKKKQAVEVLAKSMGKIKKQKSKKLE